jgi:hypothetical protein
MSEATTETAATTSEAPASTAGTPAAGPAQAQPSPEQVKANSIKASGGLLTLNKDAKVEGEQTEQTDPNAKPELIAGKYKTVEDLVKAHKELETKLGKGPEVPESYELEEITKAGITLGDEAQTAEVVKMMKDAGFTQDQVSKLGPLAAHSARLNFDKGIDFAMKALGNDPEHLETQVAQLRKDWGDSFDTRFKAVQDFAEKFPAELWHMPLKNSALGWALAERFMQEHAGPHFATDVSVNSDGANKLNEIVADPEYYRQTARGESLRKQAAEISARMSR